MSETLGITDLVALPDKELRQTANEFSKEMFAKEKIMSLSVNERLLLAKRLRRQFRSSIKQIARVVHLELHYLQELL